MSKGEGFNMTIDKYDVIQIGENAWRIEDSFVRAFLFAGTERAILLDSTNGTGDLKAVVERLIGSLPVVFVNTHADADHIGCNGQFETVYMHPAEFAYYALKSKPGDAVPKALYEGEVIDLGGLKLEVILTPGHTSGSIVLLNRADRMLIGGDTILSRVFVFGLVRNLNALIASLEMLKDRYWDAFDRIYASHYDAEIGKDMILKELACAKAHIAGDIEGVDPGDIPLEAPDFRPAALYELDGAGLYDFAK
jgi:glyoxylase-like metal-dependent hydrolase (beta-lactamase superfamily II)